MGKYGSLVTVIGKDKIVTAMMEGKKINITQFAAGTGGGAYYQPTEEQNALADEKWRGAIAESKVNEDSPNIIEIVAVIPPNEGGFTIREIAAFDEDGDMIVIANTPDTEKVIITSGAAGEVKLTIYMEISNASVVELKIDPYTVTATKQDLENHDKSNNAHPDKYADKAAFAGHINNKDIHVTAEKLQNYDTAFTGLIDHIENEEIHVTPLEKGKWDVGADTADTAMVNIAGLGIEFSALEGKLARLEDGIFNDITGNPYMVRFTNLEGIVLTKGIYNKAKNRIEC